MKALKKIGKFLVESSFANYLGDIAFKLMTYDYISKQHIKQLKENLEISGKVGRLSQKLEVYKKNVKNTLEYKELEGTKSKIEIDKKQAEEEREEYKKQLEHRGMIIDHLKKDKKGLIKFSNQIIDKIPATVMEFLGSHKHFKREPYMFINSKGFFVGHTKALKDKLGIKEDLIGKNCYKALAKRYSGLDGLRNIRNFFNTYEEKKFDIDIKDGDEEIKLCFLKEEPVLLKDLDLSALGRKKSIDTIAFIPILVKRVSKIRGVFHHDKSLDELLKEHEEEQKETYLGLVTRHGWVRGEVIGRENDVGYQALREEYLELEKQLKEKIKADKKKKRETKKD